VAVDDNIPLCAVTRAIIATHTAPHRNKLLLCRRGPPSSYLRRSRLSPKNMKENWLGQIYFMKFAARRAEGFEPPARDRSYWSTSVHFLREET
jgi:hypothetical protein